MVPSKSKRKQEVVGFVGVGLDNQDGHYRLTRSENFILVGGSEETHDKMRDTALHVNAGLRNKGKSLNEAELEEIIELFRDAEK